MGTAKDLALNVFEKALTFTGARLLAQLDGKGAPALVRAAIDDVLRELRVDFDRAIIELRYDVMGVVVAVLDAQEEIAKRDAREAYEHGRAVGEGLDVTHIDPDTDEAVKLECGCADGAHPNARNLLEGAAERDGRVCALGWPVP